MGAVVTALGTMAAIVAIGWLLGARQTLGPDARQVLTRACFQVATPCMLAVTIARADLTALLSRSALVTAASTTAVALVALVVLALAWRRPAPEVVIGTLASSYVNAGNLGLPLAVYLLGDATAVVPPLLFQLLVLAPIAFAVLDAHSAAGSGSGAEPQPRPRSASGLCGVLVRTVRNPIIVGSLVGLLAAALPWTVPSVLLGPFTLIGAAAAPLALLTFGMAMALPRTAGSAGSAGSAGPRVAGSAVGRSRPRDLVLVAVLRSIASPTFAWALGSALGLAGPELLAVVAMAALPTAQNVLVYATRHGQAEPLARDAGLLTTALAIPALLIIAATLT